MTVSYALVYPTENVPLVRLTRAALKLAGSANVTVVSGAGSQALRVPEDIAPRIYEEAGLAPDGTELPPPPEDSRDEETPHPVSRQAASGPDEESPGPDAPTPAAADTQDTGRPAGRAGGRAAKRTAAKKTTTRARTPRSSTEGDDQ